MITKYCGVNDYEEKSSLMSILYTKLYDIVNSHYKFCTSIAAWYIQPESNFVLKFYLTSPIIEISFRVQLFPIFCYIDQIINVINYVIIDIVKLLII